MITFLKAGSLETQKIKLFLKSTKQKGPFSWTFLLCSSMIKYQSLFQNAAISPILISIVFLKKFLCLKLTFSIKTNGTVVCFCNESRNGKNLKNVMYHSSSNSFFLFFGLMAIPKISAVWKLCSFTTIIPHSC